MTKSCGHCKTEQPLNMFSKDRQRPDGIGVTCRTCRSEARRRRHAEDPELKARARAATRDWMKRNVDRVRELNRSYRMRPGYKEREKKLADARVAANPDKYRKKAREWIASQPLHYRREQHLKQRYGMTVAQWEELFESQGRACAACRSTSSSHKHPWVVDHCHETGVVRGILCNKCNVVIGWLGDDHAKAKAVAKYIERMCTQLRLPKVG